MLFAPLRLISYALSCSLCGIYTTYHSLLIPPSFTVKSQTKLCSLFVFSFYTCPILNKKQTLCMCVCMFLYVSVYVSTSYIQQIFLLKLSLSLSVHCSAAAALWSPWLPGHAQEDAAQPEGPAGQACQGLVSLSLISMYLDYNSQLVKVMGWSKKICSRNVTLPTRTNLSELQ